MTDLSDDGVQQLLAQRNHAVVSTLNEDGTVHSTVVWADTLDGKLAVNSAEGRKWPRNLDSNPAITVLIYDEKNPYDYVEVRGTAVKRLEGADEHIDRLAKKYLDVDAYPMRVEGEIRVSYLVEPTKVRHQKQG